MYENFLKGFDFVIGQHFILAAYYETSVKPKNCTSEFVDFLFMYSNTVFVPFKYSEVRKRKEIDAVDEMQKKILRVTAVKSSFQNEHRSSTAHHSSISCDEKRFIHCIQESLETDDQSFVNPNAGVRIARICCS